MYGLPVETTSVDRNCQTCRLNFHWHQRVLCIYEADLCRCSPCTVDVSEVDRYVLTWQAASQWAQLAIVQTFPGFIFQCFGQIPVKV